MLFRCQDFLSTFFLFLPFYRLHLKVSWLVVSKPFINLPSDGAWFFVRRANSRTINQPKDQPVLFFLSTWTFCCQHGVRCQRGFPNLCSQPVCAPFWFIS